MQLATVIYYLKSDPKEDALYEQKVKLIMK